MAINMGNDLLFYESRRQAIERVKQQQQKAQNALKQFESFNSGYSDHTVSSQRGGSFQGVTQNSGFVNAVPPQNQASSNANAFNNDYSRQKENAGEAPIGQNRQNSQNSFNAQGFQGYQNQKRGNEFSQNNNNSGNFNSGRRPSTITGIIDNFLKGGKSGGKDIFGGGKDILGDGKDILGGLKGQIGEVSKPIQQILDAFDIDSEKLIILMVMWVLFNEKSDKTLLLALGYLLL